MLETNFHISVSATFWAAASSLAILIYLLVIVNICPTLYLQQNEESDCNSQLLNLRDITIRLKLSVLNVSFACEAFQSCMDSITVNSTPSISEAIDNWRGVSAVAMAIPTGK